MKPGDILGTPGVVARSSEVREAPGTLNLRLASEATGQLVSLGDRAPPPEAWPGPLQCASAWTSLQNTGLREKSEFYKIIYSVHLCQFQKE